MTVQQLKMWSRETVRRNRIEPAETENLSNSQKCLITLHIVGWVIIGTIIHKNILNRFVNSAISQGSVEYDIIERQLVMNSSDESSWCNEVKRILNVYVLLVHTNCF